MKNGLLLAIAAIAGLYAYSKSGNGSGLSGLMGGGGGGSSDDNESKRSDAEIAGIMDKNTGVIAPVNYQPAVGDVTPYGYVIPEVGQAPSLNYNIIMPSEADALRGIQPYSTDIVMTQSPIQGLTDVTYSIYLEQLTAYQANKSAYEKFGKAAPLVSLETLEGRTLSGRLDIPISQWSLN